MKMRAIFVVGLIFYIFVDNGVEAHEYQCFQSEEADQPYRTSYHFQSPSNWLNDPNGPMWYEGLYHLFYQYNPEGPFFGKKMVWAHSVSYDLVNWIHVKHALYPTEPYDINSCWSGSVTILPGNKPVIFYTGSDADHTQVQNLAVPKNLSDPLLIEWDKYSENPVMVPPNGVTKDDFRDPTTAWLGPDGKWNVIVGGSMDNIGIAFLYQSVDFIKWTKHEDPFYTAAKNGMWECADFFPALVNSTDGVDTSFFDIANVKHVLKASFTPRDYYIIGSYVPETAKYIPDSDFTGSPSDLRFDYRKFYASKAFFDSSKNRRILWGWVNESDNTEVGITKGWFGLQAIPRKIWLDTEGKQLLQWPIEEINKLHGKQGNIQQEKLVAGSILEIRDINASEADVDVEFELPDFGEVDFLDPTNVDPQMMCSGGNTSMRGRLGPFGLLALATEDLTEQTAIYFRIFKGQNTQFVVLMCSDQSRSSLADGIDKTTYGALLNIDSQQKKISLRSLIDHSIIESFGAGGRICITSRVYPTIAINNKAQLYVFNNGTESIKILKLNVWEMNKAEFRQHQSYIGSDKNVINAMEEQSCPFSQDVHANFNLG